MTVSLPNRVDSAHIETRYRVDRDSAGLDDTPASTPTTSHRPTAAQADPQSFPRCATARRWHDESAAT